MLYGSIPQLDKPVSRIVFGVSNWSIERIEQANDYALRCGLQPFSVTSPYFGLAGQVQDPWGGGCLSISGPKRRPGSWMKPASRATAAGRF